GGGWGGWKVGKGATGERARRGVPSGPPAASRSHHAAPRATKFPQSASAARYRLPTPTTAPIIALGPRPTRANFATPAAVSKVLRPWDQPLFSYPPMIASSVLPAATPRAGKTDS